MRHVEQRWVVVLGMVVATLLAGCGGDSKSDDAGPPVTDIVDSPECRAFCKRLETACPDTRCDPMTDCDPDGDCLEAKRRELACKADPARTELTCEHPGYSSVSVCIIPKNICGS
jgi:hypothetical protein